MVSPLRMRHFLNTLYAKYTGKPLEEIERAMDRDKFMSAEEAKAYGLIDEVFQGNTESLISMAQKAGGEMPTADEATSALDPARNARWFTPGARRSCTVVDRFGEVVRVR